MTQDTLKDAIVALSEALDPGREGAGWPDVIAWDGRPLPVQARDLLVIADAQLESAIDPEEPGVIAIRDAAEAVRAEIADPDAFAAAGEVAAAARIDAEDAEAADREAERDGTPERP